MKTIHLLLTDDEFSELKLTVTAQIERCRGNIERAKLNYYFQPAEIVILEERLAAITELERKLAKA